MNESDPLPLRIQITDTTEPFPVRLSERISQMIAEIGNVQCSKYQTGAVVSAVAERDLELAAALIKKQLPNARLGKIEVVYLTRPRPQEPYVRVRVAVPEDFYGDVASDLNQRRGLIESLSDITGVNKLVTASAPLAELIGYDAAQFDARHGVCRV